MAVPLGLPIGLTDEFSNDASRIGMWLAFLKKNQLAVMPLSEVVTKIRMVTAPALVQAVTMAKAIGAAD
jgi:hypothetical protein